MDYRVGSHGTLETTVEDLQDAQFHFVSDSQAVEMVREDALEIPKWGEGIGCTLCHPAPFDAFFVKLADGDYAEIWGIYGTVPYLHKEAYRVR